MSRASPIRSNFKKSRSPGYKWTFIATLALHHFVKDKRFMENKRSNLGKKINASLALNTLNHFLPKDRQVPDKSCIILKLNSLKQVQVDEHFTHMLKEKFGEIESDKTSWKKFTDSLFKEINKSESKEKTSRGSSRIFQVQHQTQCLGLDSNKGQILKEGDRLVKDFINMTFYSSLNSSSISSAASPIDDTVRKLQELLIDAENYFAKRILRDQPHALAVSTPQISSIRPPSTELKLKARWGFVNTLIVRSLSKTLALSEVQTIRNKELLLILNVCLPKHSQMLNHECIGKKLKELENDIKWEKYTLDLKEEFIKCRNRTWKQFARSMSCVIYPEGRSLKNKLIPVYLVQEIIQSLQLDSNQGQILKTGQKLIDRLIKKIELPFILPPSSDLLNIADELQRLILTSENYFQAKIELSDALCNQSSISIDSSSFDNASDDDEEFSGTDTFPYLDNPFLDHERDVLANAMPDSTTASQAPTRKRKQP